MAIWNLENGKWKSEAGADGPPPGLPQMNAEGQEWKDGDNFDDAQHHLVGSDKVIFPSGGFAAPAPALGETMDNGRQGGLTSDKDIFPTGGVAAPAPAPAPLGESNDHGRQGG